MDDGRPAAHPYQVIVLWPLADRGTGRRPPNLVEGPSGSEGRPLNQAIAYRGYGRGLDVPSRELAQLHAELLPSSPLHALGPGFAERFYYGVLPEEGLVFGQVAYNGSGEPVGFVAVTHDANGFLGVGLRRRWRTLLWLSVRHPPAPRRAWSAIRLLRERETHVSEQQCAEILSLAVRPAQEGQRANRERGRVARELLSWAVKELSDQPIQALVDETNLPARLMYGELGWEATGRVETGWPIPQLVFTLQPLGERDGERDA